MIYKTSDLNVCSDCRSWLANADLTRLDYYYDQDTAAARAQAIQDGERAIIAEYGRIVVGEDDGNSAFRQSCDCCMLTAPGEMYSITTWIDPVERSTNPFNGLPGVDYLDARFVVDAWRDDKYTGIDFYGSRKAPSAVIVRGADNRVRRIWVISAGNAGSAYIIVAGNKLFIDDCASDRLTAMANPGGSTR